MYLSHVNIHLSIDLVSFIPSHQYWPLFSLTFSIPLSSSFLSSLQFLVADPFITVDPSSFVYHCRSFSWFTVIHPEYKHLASFIDELEDNPLSYSPWILIVDQFRPLHILLNPSYTNNMHISPVDSISIVDIYQFLS